MRVLYITIALVALALSVCPTVSGESFAESVEVVSIPSCVTPPKDALSAVVRVATVDNKEGSGVVVGANHVLTAAHVVEESQGAALVHIDGDFQWAVVLAEDKSLDLALLSIDTKLLHPIPLSRDQLHQSEPVWVIGFPYAFIQQVTDGVFEEVVAGGRLMTTNSVHSGASGGGLVRCNRGKFELAGIVRSFGAYWNGGELIRVDDASFHTSSTQIRDFLQRNGGPSL